MQIKDIIYDICEELEIKPPKWKEVTNPSLQGFNSETTMAVYCIEDDMILLKNIMINYDTIFSLAHEIRHKWQYMENDEYFFSDYKTRDELDVEEYNLQLPELDANAFAKIYMTNCYGVEPLFEGMSRKVINAINERVKVIIETEYAVQ